MSINPYTIINIAVVANESSNDRHTATKIEFAEDTGTEISQVSPVNPAEHSQPDGVQVPLRQKQNTHKSIL